MNADNADFNADDDLTFSLVFRNFFLEAEHTFKIHRFPFVLSYSPTTKQAELMLEFSGVGVIGIVKLIGDTQALPGIRLRPRNQSPRWLAVD